MLVHSEVVYLGRCVGFGDFLDDSGRLRGNVCPGVSRRSSGIGYCTILI